MLKCGCSPYELGGGENLKNPYALRMENISGFVVMAKNRYDAMRKDVAGRDGPRTWDDIKQSFQAMSQNRPGGGMRSPSSQSPLKKKSRDVVIDLTQGDDDTVVQDRVGSQASLKPKASTQHGGMPPACVHQTPSNGSVQKDAYDPSISYFLAKHVIVPMPVGHTRTPRARQIRRVPGEFFTDPVHGQRRLNMFEKKKLGQNVQMLSFPRGSTDAGFYREFCRWVSDEFIPKAYARLDKVLERLPENNFCHCRGEDRGGKHIALPGYALDCGHVVCGSCLYKSIHKHGETPCCNVYIGHVPLPCLSREKLDALLKSLNFQVEYEFIFGDAWSKDDQLHKALQRRLQSTRSHAQRENTRNDEYANTHTSYIPSGMGITSNPLSRPTFLVSENPTSPSCKGCQKTFLPDDGTLAFGISQNNSSVWYHMNCVDSGIRFRALTQGIEDYGTMDSTKKMRVIHDIFASS